MTHKELGFVKAAMASGLNQHQALECLKVAGFPPQHGAPQHSGGQPPHQGPPQHGGQRPSAVGGHHQPPQHGGGSPTVTVDGQPLPPELAKMVLQILEQVAGSGQGGAPGAQPGQQQPGM